MTGARTSSSPSFSFSLKKTLLCSLINELYSFLLALLALAAAAARPAPLSSPPPLLPPPAAACGQYFIPLGMLSPGLRIIGSPFQSKTTSTPAGGTSSPPTAAAAPPLPAAPLSCCCCGWGCARGGGGGGAASPITSPETSPACLSASSMSPASGMRTPPLDCCRGFCGACGGQRRPTDGAHGTRAPSLLLGERHQVERRPQARVNQSIVGVSTARTQRRKIVHSEGTSECVRARPPSSAPSRRGL